jgi:hypothetical protein
VPPLPNPNVASLTTRWESRAQKDFYFFLPYSSSSYKAHKIGSCRNKKIGDDKFERRPRRTPPPKSRCRQPHHEVGISCTKRFIFEKNYLPGMRPSGDNGGEVDRGDGGQRIGVRKSRWGGGAECDSESQEQLQLPECQPRSSPSQRLLLSPPSPPQCGTSASPSPPHGGG